MKNQENPLEGKLRSLGLVLGGRSATENTLEAVRLAEPTEAPRLAYVSKLSAGSESDDK